MFHQRRQHTICFAKTFERSKKSCRVFLSPRQVQLYQRSGKKLKPVKRRWKSTRTFAKKRNNDMKRHCSDTKKIIWMKHRLLIFTRSVTRRLGRFHSLKKPQSHQSHQGLLMIQARKNRSLKKHQGQAMEKRPLQRQEKKLKRSHSLKKHQSHLNLLTPATKKKKGCPRTIKGKKLCWGWKKKPKVFWSSEG